MNATRNRSRWTLVLLAILFAAPVVGAMILHAIGWEPGQTRNHGEMFRPALDVRDAQLRRADGGPYAWEPEARRWRLVAMPPAHCATACAELVAGLDKVWQLQGRRADRLDVLWFGDLPAGAVPFRRLVRMQPDSAFAARLPRNDADGSGRPPLYLIDPTGYVAMRYPPGVDVAGVREDIARLLK